MFAYQPQTQDRSGEIMAAGQIGAAQSNAQMMGQLGQDIGGALKSIGGTIGDSMQEAREGESAYAALQSIGQMYPAIGKITGALDQLDPRTRFMAARQVLGNFGALSQFGIAGMNAGVREKQMGIQQNAPYVAQGIKNQQNVANQGGPGTPRVNLPPASAIFETGN